MPFVTKTITIPLPFSIIAIALLVIAAGLTNYQSEGSIILDSLTAIIAFSIFEYFAVEIYHQGKILWLALFNQVLAFNFLLAAYYSIRTWRWLASINKSIPYQQNKIPYFKSRIIG